jgi:hypothetical protein
VVGTFKLRHSGRLKLADAKTNQSTIMNKPTSFAEACHMMGTTAEEAISEEARKYLTPREVLSREIDYITCCINGPDYKPDHKNTKDPKFWPWFHIILDDSCSFGFRLACYGDVYAHSGASLGARLPFATADGARYMGETFADKYAELLVAEHGIKWVIDQVKE